MSLWIIIAAVTTLTAALLAAPLLRRRRSAAPPAGAPDLAVYRAQVVELNDQAAMGLISGTEATAARAEIERRMLKAGDAQLAATPDEAPSRHSREAHRPVYAIAFVSITMTGASGLYLMLGTPGLPSLPLAERGAPTEERPLEFARLVERLAAQMAENPSDPRGWLLLARSYARVERFADSARAYRRAIELGTRAAEVLAAMARL